MYIALQSRAFICLIFNKDVRVIFHLDCFFFIFGQHHSLLCLLRQLLEQNHIKLNCTENLKAAENIIYLRLDEVLGSLFLHVLKWQKTINQLLHLREEGIGKKIATINQYRSLNPDVSNI